MAIQISVINKSSSLKSSDIEPVIAALNTQVARDFAPIWHTPAQLSLEDKPSPGSWWLVLLDDSDQAGALGYHELTSEGLPLSKVFIKTTMAAGLSWTITTSHELLEMLADPDVNLSVFAQDTNTTGLLYAYEVCDPCEAETYAYEISGIKVSDFVFPDWFQSFRKPGTQFDQQHKISKPFELLPGGYIGTFKVDQGGGWQQTTARTGPMCCSHTKRVLPKSLWRYSSP